ncbi:Ditrans,polycis-undecaprenyl-diphosphate synthase ((2E,6E)-farnesyl-diphosphate specific) [Streptomyces californicus]
MKLLPLFLRKPIEAVYERRLARETLVAAHRAQVQGWSTETGGEPRSRAHGRPGRGQGGRRRSVTTFLGWCTAAGIGHVTLFMLSDDNLGRPAEELGPLIEVIEHTVRDISAEGRDWEVRAIGSLDMLPGDSARAIKEATAATAGRGGLQGGRGGRLRRPARDRRRREERLWSTSRPAGDPAELVARFGIDDIYHGVLAQSPTTPTSSSAPPPHAAPAPDSCSGSPRTPRCTGWTATGRPSGTWTSSARCAGDCTRTGSATSASDPGPGAGRAPRPGPDS